MVTFITLVLLVYNVRDSCIQFVQIIQENFYFQDEVNAKVNLNSNFGLVRQVINKCDLTAQPQCSSDCSSILVIILHL